MRIGIIALSLLFLGTACNTCPKEGMESITLEKTESLLRNPDGVQVLDVRTPGEIAATGTLANAKVIDYSSPDFEKKLEELDKCKPVLVYCASGGRSPRAGQLMVNSGFSKVYDFSGGISEWLSKGKPTVKR